MRKHVSKKVQLVPPDHINTSLSSGFGEVIETMLAKDRDARYRNPDDLILDLECLSRGEPPRIASDRTDAISLLAEAEASDSDDLPDTALAARTGAPAASGGSGIAVVVLS